MPSHPRTGGNVASRAMPATIANTVQGESGPPFASARRRISQKSRNKVGRSMSSGSRSCAGSAPQLHGACGVKAAAVAKHIALAVLACAAIEGRAAR